MKLNTRVVGRVFEIFFMGLIGFTIISWLINCIFPNWLMSEKVLKAMDDAYGYNFNKFSSATRAVLFFVGSIGTAMIVYGFWIGAKIARLVGKGEMISEQSALLFAQLKKGFIYWSVFNIAQCWGSYQFLMPKMELKMKIWGLAMMSVGHLLVFIFFASISAVITRSARLKADQDLTV